MCEIGKTSLSLVLLIFIGGSGYFFLIEYLENITKPKNLVRNRNWEIQNWKPQKADKQIDNGCPEYDQNWQKVEGLKNHKFYVYSAYYDIRPGIYRNKYDMRPAVRIIGVTRTRKSDAVTCRMYFEHDKGQDYLSIKEEVNNIPAHIRTKIKSFRDVPGKISIIWGHHEKQYSACFVLCPLPISYNFIPTFISVVPVSLNQTKVSNILSVLNSENGGTGSYEVQRKNLAVCVKPIRSHYNQTLNLIEFLEFNKILGASKFIFYNLTMSHEIDCILDFYKTKDNSVTILQWDLLKKDPHLDLHDTGGLAARNDCLYRSMNDFKYLMMTDLDEFIVPRQHENIVNMIDYLNTINPNAEVKFMSRNLSTITSYNFKNAFFYLHYGKYNTTMRL